MIRMQSICVVVVIGIMALLPTSGVLAAQDVHFTVQTLQGTALSIPLVDKKPVLLVFWASWCGSCNVEAPQMVKLNRELNGRIRVIGVNVDENTQAAVPFVKKHGLNYVSIADAQLKVSKMLGVTSTPSLILLDAQGQVLSRTTALNAEMLTAIRSLLTVRKKKTSR